MRTLVALLAAVVALVLAPTMASAGPNSPGCISKTEVRNVEPGLTRMEFNQRVGTPPLSNSTEEVGEQRFQLYRGCFEFQGRHPAVFEATFERDPEPRWHSKVLRLLT